MTARTLNDILLTVCEYALPRQSGAAESGSVTTLVDSVRKQSPGGFTSGVLFIKTGTHAGKFFPVTTYDGSTGTFTFPTVTGAISAGVQYAAFEVEAGGNLYDFISAVNQSLRDLGVIPAEDETLTTVVDQEAYNLPTGVSDVVAVWVAEDLTAPYNYRPHRHWDEVGGTLRFHTGYAPAWASYKIRLKYMTAHATLDTYEDAISRYINWNWLKYQTIVNLVRSLSNRGHNWDRYKNIFEEAQARLVNLRPWNETMLVIKAA